eukprot:8366-Heterococcus_DN1.PRE.1
MPHMKQTSTVLSSNNLSTYCNHRPIMNTAVTPQHDALLTTYEDSLLCLAQASGHQQCGNRADSVMWCDANVHAFTLSAIGTVLKTCL